MNIDDEFYVDLCDARGRWTVASGPFSTLAEASDAFEKAASAGSIKLRLRGSPVRAASGFAVYGEADAGEVFRHDPPRPVRNAR